jgi:hypothetical protein
MDSTPGQNHFVRNLEPLEQSAKGDDMNHDIDRTQIGYAQEAEGYQPRSRGSVFNEETQMNLASGLMDVNTEQELDFFLGDVISGAANAVGKFLGSPTGQALGNGLKDVAKQLLPVAGQALGTYVGGGPGGQIGGALGSAAAGMFEMEQEEAEWEAANTMVNLAAEATKKAAEMPQGGDPQAIAKKAIIEAAKIHAPGLVSSLTHASAGTEHCGCQHHHGHHHDGEHHHYGEPHYGEHHHEHHYGHPHEHHYGHEHHGGHYGEGSGRWFRHGDRIVLVGV